MLAIGNESAMESENEVASRLLGSAFASGSDPSPAIARTCCALAIGDGNGRVNGTGLAMCAVGFWEALRSVCE